MRVGVYGEEEDVERAVLIQKCAESKSPNMPAGAVAALE